MLNWLKEKLKVWLLPSEIDDGILEFQGQKWQAWETKGVRLNCKAISGIEVRMLGSEDVSDRPKFWRIWSTLNRADVRWSDGSEFDPLDS